VVSLLALSALTSLIVVMGARGFSAREQPTTLECIAARSARSLAMPADAKARTTAAATPRWESICIPRRPICARLRPRTSPMGSCFTSSRTLSGSPACRLGKRHNGDDQDSWKLVGFIRHLLKLSALEEKQMKELNPKESG
jgi:hypothetical protein